jgi:DNA-binding protein YbaB
MLQDMILSAVNEVLKKGKDLMQSEMSQITGGMKIPGLF